MNKVNTSHESYVLFELAGSIYGIPSQNVQHIDMFEHVTRVPNANPAIDGVVFSRGQVIPALNLRVALRLSSRRRIHFGPGSSLQPSTAGRLG